jgi:hypothetical protein
MLPKQSPSAMLLTSGADLDSGESDDSIFQVGFDLEQWNNRVAAASGRSKAKANTASLQGLTREQKSALIAGIVAKIHERMPSLVVLPSLSLTIEIHQCLNACTAWRQRTSTTWTEITSSN